MLRMERYGTEGFNLAIPLYKMFNRIEKDQLF